MTPHRGEPIFAQSPIPTAYVTLDGMFAAVNDAFCTLTGYSEDELLRRTWMSITHPDDLEPDKRMVQEVIAAERRGYSMVKRYIGKVGNVVWVTLHVRAVDEANGEKFLVWAVALPNHGKFKPVLNQDSGEVHVRPVVKLGEFVMDNWKSVVPILFAIGAGVYRIIRWIEAIAEKTGVPL